MSESVGSSSNRRRRRRISMKLVSSSSSSSSKLVEIWVEEEETVKLESICGALGLRLDPSPSSSSLKLNKHLIKSNTLTWKSLLSFFASRGFPTGSSSNDPLIINHHHHHQTNKRGHDPHNWDTYNSGIQHYAQMEHVNVFKKLKIDNNNNAGTHIPSSGRDWDHQTTRFNRLSLKRKPVIEDVSMLKKPKLNESNPGNQPSTPNTISDSQLGSSCISRSKRPREVERS